MKHSIASVIGFMLLAGLNSVSAFALPQVSENAAQNFAGILTLYPDSHDPNLAYFIPSSGGIVTDGTGTPSIGFTYWGLNPPAAEAGAYMSFSMKLQSDAAQAEALRGFLASGKRIAVVPLKDSIVRLSKVGGGPGDMPLSLLFKEFNFSERAAQAEAEVGVNAILTPVGARVMKVALETPQALKLDYCFKFDGLGPMMEADISVNWRQVYDHLATHASAGGFWFRASLDAELEKLRSIHAVNIVIRGGNAKMEDYVKKLAQDAANRLFVSELGHAPVAGSRIDGWSFSRLQLKATHREELKEEAYHYSNQDLVEREACLDLKVGSLQPYLDRIIRNADGR